MATKLHIKKGDTVKVIAGNNKGDVGRVLVVNPTKMTVLVEGVNLRSKAVRPSQKHPNGVIVKQEAPVHYSNVMLVDKQGKPTRVRTTRKVDNNKTVVRRIAVTTGEEL